MQVNGVDVIPFVEAELNRRFPGRADRRAGDPEGLRAAWAALERTWAGTLERAAAMLVGTVDVSVDAEWSFAQTLRHLVLATDMWLRRAILEVEQPFHPLGLPNAEYETDGNDLSIFTTGAPSYADVLDVRAGRVAMVRDFIASVTPDELAATRRNPMIRHTRRPPCRACTSSSRRNGNTTATPYATLMRSEAKSVE
jgi:hypothetical protein